MQHPSLLFFSTLPLLFPSTFSRTIPTRSSNATSESWLIPRLDMHYMMSESGLPIGWPDWARFPSTIDFDIDLPSGQQNCQASWPNGTLPDAEFLCTKVADDITGAEGFLAKRNPDTDIAVETRSQDTVPLLPGQVLFGMTRWYGLGERRPEMSFVLRVRSGRESSSGGGSVVQFVGSQNITANMASEPTSYMTCLVGRPLDGERCHINSYLSVRKDLVIEAVMSPEGESEG